MKKKFFILTMLLFVNILLFGCNNLTTTTITSTMDTDTSTTTNTVANITTTANNDSLPLTILSINDLHGYIEQDASGKGGLSNTAYLINQIRNEDNLDDVVLLANGDMFQGTAISNMTDGKAVLDCMNEMGFDAMGIGNHEFDWGISTILKYFDNDNSNGEADFPLINDNIYLNSDNSMLTVAGGDVLNSVVLNKEGVKVGIISYIGNVYSSIEYDKVEDYNFDENISNSVKQRASALKDSGVDVIIVNIHGGGSNIDTYINNTNIAQLKDANGNYLVDAVINGHTHAYQQGAIKRSNGVDMPVVQAGSYDEYFGDITLSIDLNSMKVTDSTENIIAVSSAGTHYDPTVESIIDNYSEELGNEVLATAGETITSTSQLYNWTGNVMLAATGSDIAISNNEGVRSTGEITSGQPVTLNQMYEISPFDNTILVFEATYSQIQSLLNSPSVFYTLADGVTLNDSETYKVAVISYVYYWDQLANVRSSNDIDTGLLIRNILVDDIKQKGLAGELFSPRSNPVASIGLQY